MNWIVINTKIASRFSVVLVMSLPVRLPSSVEFHIYSSLFSLEVSDLLLVMWFY